VTSGVRSQIFEITEFITMKPGIAHLKSDYIGIKELSMNLLFVPMAFFMGHAYL